MGENLLPGIVSVEEGATALDGEEGGDFGFGGFELPGGEFVVWEVACCRRISPVTLDGESARNYGGG